jgi:hypothetical protein
VEPGPDLVGHRVADALKLLQSGSPGPASRFGIVERLIGLGHLG